MTPSEQAANFSSTVAAIIAEAKAHAADGLDVGDALWALSTIAQLMSAVRVFKGLPKAERKLTVLRAWDQIQDNLPTSAKALRSNTADRVVEIVYNVAEVLL